MDKNINDKVDLSLSNEEFYRRYKRKKTVGMFTLGCKVNQYETEALAEIFEDAGYETVGFEDKADVYVINTCTVTNLSDRKSRQMIRKARSASPDAVIAVTGCYAQTAPDEVGSIPGVNLIIGTRQRSGIIGYIEEYERDRRQVNAVGNIMKARDFEKLHIERYKERTRAFLKIQEGCSQFCSYCIIPYARGPIRSRDPEDVLDEVAKLSKAGFKEVVLTGIHIASYGRDTGNTSLLDIIRKIHGIEGIERIRLGSIEPTTITEEFVETAGKLSRLCPHYHVSLQSGCDATLKRMNRKYTSGQYKKAITLLRSGVPDVSVTTDVMVGFPGETDAEFEETYEFVKEIVFSKMHVFKFSPRKGTPAAGFEGQVPSEAKDERSRRLIELSLRCGLDFNSRHVGRLMPVLFEQEVKDMEGYIEGLTPNYIRVLCPGNEALLKGNIVNARLEKAEADYMTGVLQNISNGV